MSGATRGEFRVLVTVESKDHPVAPHQDRTFDQVGLLHHEIDGFFLGLRQRPLFEHGAPGADEIQESFVVYVPLQELPIWRILVDVTFGDVDLVRFQKTSGVAAGRSGRFPIKRDARHERHCTPAVSRMETRRLQEIVRSGATNNFS
jgi:hypothetical protein